NLDAKGNPKPGAKPPPAIPELVSKSPLPDDQAEMVATMQELTAALIEFVPASLKSVRYEIRSPDHPGEDMTEPNTRVDQAASRLVRLMNPSNGAFPGLLVTMQRMDDGNWRN